MADILISKSRGKKYIGGSSPMVPAFIVGDDPIPLNPPGSNTSHSPVTIGSPANGLSLAGQVLSLNPNDIGAVLITGTQTITGAKTFSNGLFVLSGNGSTLRIASNNNLATINFQANSNEEKATLEYSDATNVFSIATRINNSDISITPHGTGKIKLSNVPTGTGDVLMRDASNNLVIGGAGVTESYAIWTPVLSSSGATVTYGQHTSIYYKVGRLLHFSSYLININTTGTPTGPFIITGLSIGPVNGGIGSFSDESVGSIGQLGGSSLTEPEISRSYIYIDSAASQGRFTIQLKDALTPILSFTNGLLKISGTYITN